MKSVRDEIELIKVVEELSACIPLQIRIDLFEFLEREVNLVTYIVPAGEIKEKLW